jgi:dihydrofolate reductase
MISVIAAIDENNGIGKNGFIPWCIPEDLKRFKEFTKNSVVIMGRITYESIGAKPLPDRINIVITSNTESIDKRCFACINLKYAIQLAMSFLKDIFIIGGSNIYKEALPISERILLTKVAGDFECDAVFPIFNEDLYDKICDPIRARNQYTYQYITYNLKSEFKLCQQEYIRFLCSS